MIMMALARLLDSFPFVEERLGAAAVALLGGPGEGDLDVGVGHDVAVADHRAAALFTFAKVAEIEQAAVAVGDGVWVRGRGDVFVGHAAQVGIGRVGREGAAQVGLAGARELLGAAVEADGEAVPGAGGVAGVARLGEEAGFVAGVLLAHGGV
ncbi:hypothetical protein PG996_015910 [Apiospora saccharicola]|uniref:Uncharacterized protein n=1 Tax=Apiospora saccharicola TaxID=335842 RepID=A0ABR1TME7_9PEZI